MAKKCRSAVPSRKRAANPKGGTLRVSKRAKCSSPTSLPTTDHHLGNLPFIPLLKILRFLDARSLERIRCGSRSLNEFVVGNRSRLTWRIVNDIVMERNLHREMETIYSDRKTIYHSWKRDQVDMTDRTKGAPSTSSSLIWLAKNYPNCFIKCLDLRRFCIDGEDLREAAQRMVERKLQIGGLFLGDTDIRVDSAGFIRFLNTFSPVEITIFPKDLQEQDIVFSLIDDSFFTYMNKLVAFTIVYDEYNSSSMFIQVPVSVDKIPKKFATAHFFILPLTTVVNAIRDWYESREEFGDWSISISHNECPNLEHLANAINLNRAWRVTHKGKQICIRNRGKKRIVVRMTGELQPSNAPRAIGLDIKHW